MALNSFGEYILSFALCLAGAGFLCFFLFSVSFYSAKYHIIASMIHEYKLNAFVWLKTNAITIHIAQIAMRSMGFAVAHKFDGPFIFGSTMLFSLSFFTLPALRPIFDFFPD